MAENSNSKRLSHIDIAKVIAIFLVIVGHVRSDIHEIIPYKSLIYAFHMPLFFIISGMFVCTYRNYSFDSWKAFFKKNFQNLIIPFIIFGLIYMNFSYYNFLLLGYGTRLSLVKIGSLTSLWFLPVLFLARVYIECLFCLAAKFKINPNKIIPIFILLFIAIGVFMPHYTNDNEMGNLWGYDIALVAAGFMLFGKLIRPMIEYLSTRKKLSAILSLVFVILFLFGFNMTNFSKEFILMCQGVYQPWFLINSITGSLAVLTFSIVIDSFVGNNKVVKFIGLNTMGIYLIHKNMLNDISFILQKIGINMEVTSFSFALIVGVIALVLSCFLVMLIKRYIPEILGSRQI